MKKVLLVLDPVNGAIYPSESDTGNPLTGIDIIDNAEYLSSLNLECSLAILAYEIVKEKGDPSHLQECKEGILNLVEQLKVRLNEINDGSFEVVDNITNALK